MNKNEVEFLNALRKVGLSRSLCESVNEIRKSVFESEEESVESTDESKYELAKRTIAGYVMDNLGTEKWDIVCPDGAWGSNMYHQNDNKCILDADGLKIEVHESIGDMVYYFVVDGLSSEFCEKLGKWRTNVCGYVDRELAEMKKKLMHEAFVATINSKPRA